MALTLKELTQHVEHYAVYGSLPFEVMQELFDAATIIAGMEAGGLPVTKMADDAVKTSEAPVKKSRSKQAD